MRLEKGKEEAKSEEKKTESGGRKGNKGLGFRLDF